MFKEYFEKSILEELDNPSEEVLLATISQEILIQGKEYNLKNFITEIKKLNYKALPHFATATRHLNKTTKRNFDKSELKEKRIITLVTRMEIAELLMNQGATIEEIRAQTNLPEELMVLLFRQYYGKLDVNLLRFRLIQYHQQKLNNMIGTFFKEAVVPLLKQKDKLYAEALLSSYSDLMEANNSQLAALEILSNEND